MTKRVIILGSTGSIGRNALAVVEALAERCELVGLAAGSNAESLAEQANRLRPRAVALADEEGNAALRRALAYTPHVLCGAGALESLVEDVPCDCVVAAVVGIGGLGATLAAARLGRRIALANKEALVIAGALLVPLAEAHGAEIIPVDSEHSAIHQALHAGRRSEVRAVYLTASGGPFRTAGVEQMESATLADALDHPVWDMGPKVTIDSATMMNKALEVVEAHWLFGLAPDRIRVIVHPESVIHSIVEFCDGSMIAQLGTPDMRTPIQYALTYPHRWPCPSERLDLSRVCRLNLEPPDGERFPALALGYEAARRGGTAGAVLNAANEEAVKLFRRRAIGFCDIARHVAAAMAQHQVLENPSLDDLLAADHWARDEVARCTAC